MPEPAAWVNGRLVNWSDAGLPLWDLGVVAGAAVTEAGRTYAGRFLWAEAHIHRLCNSLQQLGFPQQFTPQQLLDAAHTVIEANITGLPAGGDLGVVLFSTAGVNATYLGHRSNAATTVVHTYPLPFGLWRKAFTAGVSLRIPTVRQIPPECFPVEFKVRNRLHWWLADREADRIESGSRALLTTQDGLLTETSTACLFVVQNGRIRTPQAHVLESLSRDIVQELAAELGMPVDRCNLRLADLLDAQEVFLSSSPSCLTPVCCVEGQPVGGEFPGPIFRRLLGAWSNRTGVDLERQLLAS
ncbi:MAG: D-alanine aminotransferase [Planctomycetota bacterium]|jgi:branched-subunit amino acid aminotransferase/4-amino-4-deoxychorismate lyase